MNAPMPPKEPDIKLPDPEALSRSMADIAARSQKLVAEWMKRQAADGLDLDPLNVSSAFMEMTAKLLSNPSQLMEAQIGLWRDYMTLWQNTARRIWSGEEPAPVISHDPKDKRFADPAWRQNEIFDFIKQSYLLSARYIKRRNLWARSCPPRQPELLASRRVCISCVIAHRISRWIRNLPSVHQQDRL